MKIFDLHQDLMSHLRFREKFSQSYQTDIASLQKEVDLVVATAFPLPSDDNHYSSDVPALITEEINLYLELIKKENIQLVISPSDVSVDQLKMILHIEGLNVFSGTHTDWNQLDQWVMSGVRSIGTHWNVDNALGGGTLNSTAGLTVLGSEVIDYVENNQLLFDFAHMGRQTFTDAAKLVNRPIYVSHGNSDVLCENVRNYTDQQLKTIADSGGVIGVFFANTFVVGADRSGTIQDVVNHILYIKNLIGIDHVALGSDFGGIVSGTVQGLASVNNLSNLYQALFMEGLTELQIEQIFWKNAQRIIRDHLS